MCILPKFQKKRVVQPLKLYLSTDLKAHLVIHEMKKLLPFATPTHFNGCWLHGERLPAMEKDFN